MVFGFRTYTDYIKVELPDEAKSDLTLKGYGYTSLLEIDEISIPLGSTEVEFRIGCDTFDITRTSYIYWELSGSKSSSYHTIYPLEIMILPYKNVSVSVEYFDSIPAGGRTEPLTISLQRAPMYEMIFKIYKLTTDPELFGVFPHTITFRKGESENVFWLSVDEDAYGDAGAIIFVMRGDLVDTYTFPTRRYDFIITAPSPIMNPTIVNCTFSPVTDLTMQVNLEASEAVTIYFALAPRGTHDISWAEVRQKHLLYDYYAGKVILGEFIEDSPTFEYSFTVTGFKINMDYFIKIWIQSAEGALCEDPYRYNFTTFADKPQLVHFFFYEELDSDEMDDFYDTIATLLGIDESRVLSIQDFEENYPLYEDFWLGEEILDSIDYADYLTGFLPFEVLPKDVLPTRKSTFPEDTQTIDDYIGVADDKTSDSNGYLYDLDLENYDYEGIEDFIDSWNSDEDRYFTLYKENEFFDSSLRTLKFDDDDEFYYKASFPDVSVYLRNRIETYGEDVDDLYNVSFYLLPDYENPQDSTGVLEQLLDVLSEAFNYIRTRFSEFDTTTGFISGSYEKMRTFWGLYNNPRVKEIRPTYVVMDGFDLQNNQCNLVVAAYLPERADYSPSMDVPSSVIRYLQGSDSFSDSSSDASSSSSSSSEGSSNVVDDEDLEEEFVWCDGEIIVDSYFDMDTFQEVSTIYCEGEENYEDVYLPDCEELEEPSYLTYACDGEGMTSSYRSEQYLRIIHYTQHTEMPTPYQIANGLDSTNYKALSTNTTIAESMNNTVTISGLYEYKAHLILVTAECFDEDTGETYYMDKNQTVEFFVIAYDASNTEFSGRLSFGFLISLFLAFWVVDLM